MLDLRDKVARYQELERRGMLEQIPPEKQQIWAEIKARGLDKKPVLYSKAEKAKYTTRAAVEGATMGLGDVLAGYTNAQAEDLAQITHGADWKTRGKGLANYLLHLALPGTAPKTNAFKQGRADFVNEQNDFKDTHPGLNLAGEIVGGLASGVGGAGKVAGAKALSGLGKYGVGAATGAGAGAAYGFGNGLTQDPDRLDPVQGLKGAAQGAVLGGVFGTAVPAVFAAGNKMAHVLNRNNRALKKVIQASGGEENLNRALQSRTPLLDRADENLMRLAEGAKLNNPKAAQIYRNYGEQRLGQQRSILEHTIDDHFGNQGFSQRLEKMNLERQAKDGPLYQKAIYGQDGKGVHLDNLKLNPDEADYVNKVYKTTGYKNDVRGKAPNHMRVLDYAKQLMDSDIAKAAKYEDGNKVANLTRLKNDFLAKIDAQNPTYKQARGVYEQYARLEDAMKTGRKINSGSISERRFELDGMSQPEKEHYVYGVREKLLENFNNHKSGKGNLTKKVFDQNTMQRLKLLPLKDYNGLAQTVQRESLAAENINRLLGGSQTAERQMSVGQTAMAPRRSLRRWLGDKIDRVLATDEQVARMMTDPGYAALVRAKAGMLPPYTYSKLSGAGGVFSNIAGPLTRPEKQILRKQIQGQLMGTVRGTSVPNAALGKDIRFNKEGIGKAISSSANEQKLYMLAHAPELAQKGIPLPQASQPKNPNYTYLYTPVDINGRKDVAITVLEQDGQQQPYFHNVNPAKYFQQKGSISPAEQGRRKYAAHQTPQLGVPLSKWRPLEGLTPYPLSPKKAETIDKGINSIANNGGKIKGKKHTPFTMRDLAILLSRPWTGGVESSVVQHNIQEDN